MPLIDNQARERHRDLGHAFRKTLDSRITARDRVKNFVNLWLRLYVPPVEERRGYFNVILVFGISRLMPIPGLTAPETRIMQTCGATTARRCL
jgi:hypothetical protein